MKHAIVIIKGLSGATFGDCGIAEYCLLDFDPQQRHNCDAWYWPTHWVLINDLLPVFAVSNLPC